MTVNPVDSGFAVDMFIFFKNLIVSLIIKPFLSLHLYIDIKSLKNL